ncbi:YesL family protein [Trichococcus shcherbakoviae]|uniref:DUF624 domain-containing protein n=1 Tax=Trichococcus shcherbakoviae subsp. psychrophilus TaxID=2585775 RepID=A0A5C5E9S7_9LACT|nr:DUF624 domain-containing protein [Trichococcus shcherbakoviae]TNV69724.1 DUF624 domain-containing protein [Trichococcus shcherbakoviae subsp. psychrophilus]
MNWEKLYNGTEKIYDCLRLNSAVILGTLLGLGIFGLAPSLQAAHHVAKSIHQQKGINFYSSFFTYYRKHFIPSNKIFLSITLLYGLPMLAVQQLFLPHFGTGALLVFLVSQGAMLATLNTLFAMYEFYELPIRSYFPSALKFLTYNPFGCLLALLWLGICSTVSYLLPGLLPFLSIGVWVYGNMGLYLKYFEDNEDKVKGAQLNNDTEMVRETTQN